MELKMFREPEFMSGTRPVIVFGAGFLAGFVIGLALAMYGM
jgi:hypothetical protein